MTKKRRHATPVIKQAAAYVQDMRTRLGLSEWDIHLGHEYASDDCEAQVYITGKRTHARMLLSKNWSRRSPESQRNTVIHELLHLRLYPVEQVVYDLMCYVPEEAEEFVELTYRHANEVVVDQLASTLSPFMPLPEQVFDK